MKRLSIFIFIATSLFACKKKDDDTYSGRYVAPENCMITKWEHYSGDVVYLQKDYQYDRYRRLSRIFNYYLGEYRTTDYMHYDGQQVIVFTSADSTGQDLDTAAILSFNASRLSKVFYRSNEFSPLNSTEIYEYGSTGSLRKIYSIKPGSEEEIDVTTDNNGNPVRLLTSRINGAIPGERVELVLEYGNKLNPYYHLPNKRVTWNFFAKNNPVQFRQLVNDSTTYLLDMEELSAHQDNYIREEKRTTQYGSGNTVYYYSCD